MDSQLCAKALIPYDVGGFYIREIGVFDSENNLLIIGKQLETYKPVEGEGSIKELWVKVILEAINPDVIELKIDSSKKTKTKYSKLYQIILLAIATGLKRAEILALTIKDIDLEKRKINVNKTIVKRQLI